MVSVFVKGKNDPIELVDKEDLVLTTDLLKDAKWSNHTVNGAKLIPNDDRLATQWIPVADVNSKVIVKFTPSAEITSADIIGVPDLQATINSYEHWHYSDFTVDLSQMPDFSFTHMQSYPTSRYIMVVLETIKKMDRPNCQIQVTQEVNVVDYIKNNFDALQKHIES